MKTLGIASISYIVQFLIAFVFLSSPLLVMAESPAPVNNNPSPAPTYNNPSPAPYSGNGGGSKTIQNPLKVNSIAEFISALLKAVIAIGIPIAILFIVLAGFKFIAAQGSPDKLSEARTNFMYVVIGIAIFIGASALAELVMATLRQIGVNV